MDTIDILGIVFQCINSFVLSPIILYFLYQFHINKNDAMMQHRSRILIYVINFLTLFCLNVERVYTLSACVWLLIDIPIWTIYCFESIAWWATMDLFVIKAWYLYYQQRFNLSVADMAWKQNINPSKIDWYINNKNKYGNIIFLIKLAFIPYSVSVIIESVVPYITGEGISFVHALIASMHVSFAFIITFKTRTLKDVYWIRDEMFCQCALMMIAWILSMFKGFYFQVLLDESIYNQRMERLLHLPIKIIVSVALSIVSTAYPLHKCKQKRSITLLKRASATCTNVASLHINHFISEYHTFKQFMQHLVSAFCAENLYFIVELVQIKHHYQMRNGNVVRISTIDGCFKLVDFNINPDNIDKEKTFCTYLFDSKGCMLSRLCLTSELLSSSILSDFPNSLFCQMKALYVKYIKLNSNYTLNISHETRSTLIKYFGCGRNDNIYPECELFNIMDECCFEIIGLLWSSRISYKSVHGLNDTMIDDISLKKMIASGKVPVLRNDTSYSAIQRQYLQTK